jgi:sensor histidine kinase YesM
MDAKARIRFTSIALFITMFAVWAVSFVVISGYITDSAEKQVSLAADQIIERLSEDFFAAERLSYRLKQNAEIQALVREQDVREFFSLAGNVDALSTGEDNTHGFVGGIVLFGTDGICYRLSGTLGNKACSILYEELAPLTMPSHIAIELDGKHYIGYADEIPDGGVVAVLTEEEKILEIIRAYDQSGSLLVAISAGGKTVAANTDRVDLIPDAARPSVTSSLGVTPYDISVAADPSYRNTSLVSFSIVAAITAAIFAAVLLTYTGFLNRSFFRPMVSVAESITSLQTEAPFEALPYVQSAEFDNLVDKINEMLLKIETKNAEVLAAELRAMNAELEKQKAFMLSLQKQINAHFTVNTLEAIRTAVEQGELYKAEELMSGLTRIVRYAYSKEEYINIWDELEILKYFTEIMNTRYGGKITAEFDFHDDLMDLNMPRMLLQPIIENAVVHGFKGKSADCQLTVKAEPRGGDVCFTVSDNGRGMSEAALVALRERLDAAPDSAEGLESVALVNIASRLRHYCGGNARLNIAPSVSGGIEVSFEIPVMTESEVRG